jgi:hypothetical protein
VAWDVIPLLLPFAVPQEPQSKEAEDAESTAVIKQANDMLDYLASNGNSKEVFLVVTGKIQSLDFRRPHDESDDEDEDDFDDEEDDEVPERDHKLSPAAFASAKVLLRLLSIIQKRIKTKKPSNFLTTSLLSLVSLITKASRSLPLSQLCEVIDLSIQFVETVIPKEDTSDSAIAEDRPIQIKLIQAFITHSLESFLTLAKGHTTTLWWSAEWDEHIRPEKTVPSLIKEEYHGGTEAYRRGKDNRKTAQSVVNAILVC